VSATKLQHFALETSISITSNIFITRKKSLTHKYLMDSVKYKIIETVLVVALYGCEVWCRCYRRTWDLNDLMRITKNHTEAKEE
jgi:hypothetical protein